MAADRLFLGIDGGQSSTKAVIGDASGRLLGRGRAGPSNHPPTTVGLADLRAAVCEVIDDALGAAGLPPDTRFEAACVGLSGGAAGKRETVEGNVAAAAVRVVDDSEAALAGAVQGGAGVVVIAGTGSIALAKGLDGAMDRCGGWGYLFGDEGGAFSIVRSALRLALAAEEGWGAATGLAELFLGATGSDTVNEAMHCFYRPDWPRDRVAALAREIDAAAEAGDVSAGEVLQGAGHCLGDMAVTVAEMLDLPAEQAPIRHVGGVFCSETVLGAFKARCEERGRRAGEPAHDGATGALLLAYEQAGVAVQRLELK